MTSIWSNVLEIGRSEGMSFFYDFVEFANRFPKGLYQFTLTPAKLVKYQFHSALFWLIESFSFVWLQKNLYTFNLRKQGTSTKWPQHATC